MTKAEIENRRVALAAASQSGTSDPRRVMKDAELYLLWLVDDERNLANALLARYEND